MVVGFTRDCWKTLKIGIDSFTPRYILKLIQNWVSDEYVHLLSSNGIHYTISVDIILSNLK